MRREKFSMFPRNGKWYVQFYNPLTCKYLPARSTRESSRSAALLVIAEWLKNGIPEPLRGVRRLRSILELLDLDTALVTLSTIPLSSGDVERIVSVLRERGLIRDATVGDGPGSESLVAFLERFWNYQDSPYVRERIAHGQRISRHHCHDAHNRLRAYWQPYFKNEKTLSSLRRSDIDEFSLWLKEKRALKPNTINRVLSAGTVALHWAVKNDLIHSNPAEGLMTFSAKAAKRGVLTDAEVKELFALQWSDERCKVGNMLAMSTGLRAGETIALQVRDIGDDRLFIRHSWNDWDNLKGTKTEAERAIPIIPSMRAALLDLARRNPNGVGPTSFVFWSSTHSRRPMQSERLVRALSAALLRLRLTDEELKDPARVHSAHEYWAGRRVVFHSWRHYFAARMADRLEKRKVMLATGHANGAVFDAYAEHSTEETFQEVEKAATAAFAKLLSFPPSTPQIDGDPAAE